MQRLEVSGAVRPIYWSLGVKRLIIIDARCKHEDQCLKFVRRDKSFPKISSEKQYYFKLQNTALHGKWEVNTEMGVRGWI